MFDFLNFSSFGFIFRAIEVAIAGNHTIQFVFTGNGSYAQQAVEFTNGIAQTRLASMMPVCPCGNYQHPTRACYCTPEQIAHHRLDHLVDADMHLQFPEPDIDDVIKLYCHEQLRSLSPRFPRGNFYVENKEKQLFVDPTARSLIRQAYHADIFTTEKVRSLVSVARTIQLLANESSEIINATSMAEAIQYMRDKF